MSIKFSLIVVKGSDESKTFEFDLEEITIGRIADNTLILNDQTVSRKHARIEWEDHQFKLKDLNSQNGIQVNGEKIERTTLQDGDKITIGTTIFQFKITSIPSPAGSNETLITEKSSLEAPNPDELKQKLEDDLKTLPDQKNKLLALIKKPAIGIPLGVTLILFIIFLVVGDGGKYPKKTAKTAPNFSEKAIPLPANGVYGNTKGDRSHPDKIIFTFNYQANKLLLDYELGEISQDEVTILLNGNKISNVPSSRNWFNITKYELPREHLLSNDQNQLVFDNTHNPPKKDTWGIRNVKLTEIPYPDCSALLARESLKRGDLRYEEKLVSYGKTFDAYVNYRQAIDYLEKCPDKPDFYLELRQKLKTVTQELDNEYQQRILSAKDAFKLKNLAKVKKELNTIIKLIPEPDDYRYKKAKKLLKQYTSNK